MCQGMYSPVACRRCSSKGLMVLADPLPSQGALKSGAFPVELNGKEYGLLFSLNALDEVQEKFGDVYKRQEYTEALGNGHHKRVVSIIVGD